MLVQQNLLRAHVNPTDFPETLNVPAGGVGDELFLYVFNGADTDMTFNGILPTGYTKIASDSMSVASQTLWHKVSDGTETTVTIGCDLPCSLAIIRVSGGKGYDVVGHKGEDNNGNNVLAPTISTNGQAGDLLLACAGTLGSAFTDTPVSMSLIASITSGSPGIVFCTEDQPIHGATGTRSFNATSAARRGAIMWSVKKPGRSLTPRRYPVMTGGFTIQEV